VPLPKKMMERAVTSIESGDLKDLNKLYDEINKFDDTYLSLNRGKFRPALPEETPPGAIWAQVDETTGKVFPVFPQSGMEIESTKEGGWRVIQGPGAGQAQTKAAAQKEAREIADLRSYKSVLGSSVQALGKIDEVLSENPVFAAAQGILSRALPATEEGQLSVMFENMRNETSKATLFELKEITGAVGQTTEKEWPRYESRFGKIEIGMEPKQLKDTIKLNTLNSFEAVYGSPDKMIKLLKDDKATQEQFNEYVDSYSNIRNELNIPKDGILGYESDWSKFNEELLRNYTGLSEKDQQAPASKEASNLRQRLDAIMQGISSGGTQ
jgi:hypothetical protein